MSTIYEIGPAAAPLIALLEKLDACAVAYSGGVDSALLLKAAADVLGERCMAITALSPAFPEEGDSLCQRQGIRRVTFTPDVLSLEGFRSNPPDRCYHCKRFLFRQMQELAAAHGVPTLLDGSNRDDLSDYRPGMKALRELGVRSPLMECGLGKKEIRSMARSLGLAAWNRPSAPCLASRIPYGEVVTAEKLERIGCSEAYLHALGYEQCRVRSHGDLARIEVPGERLSDLLAHRAQVTQRLRSLGFAYVTLDLQGLRSGSLNEVLHGEEAQHGTA